jgi:hypothetical protein
LLWALPALGQPFTVSGVAVDALDGHPLTGVHVRLVSQMDRGLESHVWSDGNGRVSTSLYNQGVYDLIGELTGYHQVLTSDGNMVWAFPELDSKPVRVLMSKDAVVVTHTVDEHGNPVSAGVQVTAIPEAGEKYFRHTQANYTDQNGEWRLALTPGRYKISARLLVTVPSADGHVDRGQKYEPTESEVSASADSETRIEIPFRLRQSTDLSISGEVRGISDGGATVQIESGSLPDAMERTAVAYVNQRNPKFAFTNLEPQYHRVYAFPSNQTNQLHSQVVDLTPGDTNGDPIVLTLSPTFSVTFGIEWSERTDHESTQILLRPVGPNIGGRLFLSKSAPSAFAARIQEQFRSTPDADGPSDPGLLEIADVLPNLYRVERFGLVNAYIKQIFLGEAELQNGLLDLRGGPPAAPLKIIFSAKTGRLRLELVDEIGRSAPVSPMLVPDGDWRTEAIRQPNYNWDMKSAQYSHLRPGRYRVIWTDAIMNETIDGAWLKRNGENAPSIDVREFDGEEQVETVHRAKPQ